MIYFVVVSRSTQQFLKNRAEVSWRWTWLNLQISHLHHQIQYCDQLLEKIKLHKETHIKPQSQQQQQQQQQFQYQEIQRDNINNVMVKNEKDSSHTQHSHSQEILKRINSDPHPLLSLKIGTSSSFIYLIVHSLSCIENRSYLIPLFLKKANVNM
jgi:hypothetical protein